jgi:hypothetical protein
MTSCGFDRPTDQVYTPGVGVNERSGQVDVLHALIVSDSEGSGTVVASLANNDTDEGDSLTRIAGSGEDSSLSVTLDGPVDIPAGGAVQLLDETEVAAEGKSVESGSFVELTFSFERGENVTVQVPVVARRGDFADVPVPSSEAASAAKRGKAKASEEPTPSEEASSEESSH